MIFRVNANAIIFDKKYELTALLTLLPDLNLRDGLIPHVFGGVVDQVLQDLYQTLAISINSWQAWLSLNRYFVCFELSMNKFQCFPYDVIKKNLLG